MESSELREIDIKIAKAIGFYIERGAFYTPKPRSVLLGGDVQVHMFQKEITPEIEAQIWRDYTPRFCGRMDEAMFLLDFLREQYFVSYNLFLENDMVHHTAEIGHWGAPEHPDYTFTGCEKTPAHAICQAVLKFLDAQDKERKEFEAAMGAEGGEIDEPNSQR
jgi:hypothetical protein